MKKLIAAFCLAAVTAAFGEVKLGTVDVLKLVKNHPNYESNRDLMKSTEKDYQKKLEAIKADGEKFQEEGKKLVEQLQNPMLAAKAKADLEKQVMDIQKKLAAIEQQYRSEAMRTRQELNDLEGRLLKSTTEDLRKRIKVYADANGYDFVLDKTTTPFSKDSYEITDEILKAMGVDPKVAKAKEDESK